MSRPPPPPQYTADQLTWPFIQEETERLQKEPATWEGFCRFHELKRSFCVHRLPPPEREEWTFSIWVELHRALLEHARKTLPLLTQEDQRRNMLACIQELEWDMDYFEHPLTEEQIRIMDKIFGTDSLTPEDKADWWKSGS